MRWSARRGLFRLPADDGRRARTGAVCGLARGFILVLFGAFLLVPPALAQEDSERAETERRMRELQAQIAEDEQKIAQTTEAERATRETLEDLDRQIALRTELIQNYRKRISQIASEGDSLRTSLANLEEELIRLQTQYRRRAIHAYKYGRMHDLALILASRSINEVLIRVNYLRRFAQRRREKLTAIAKASEAQRARRNELLAMQQRTQELLAAARAEQHRLEHAQRQRQQVIAGLRQQRQTLQQSLSQRQAALQQLSARLTRLAEAASTRSRTRAAERPADAEAFSALTGSFLQNRGRLPWPVSGVVREPFGDRVDPVYGTKTPNPGILIDTQAGAEVRSIFAGRVVEVSVLPDFGTYVAIEHGAYQTIYSNFSATFVSEGQHVEAGQVIGRAGTDAEPRGRALFFGLFTNKQFVDPQAWLRPR